MTDELERQLSHLTVEQLRDVAKKNEIDCSGCEIKEEYIVVITDSQKVRAEDISSFLGGTSQKKPAANFNEAEKLLYETKQSFDSGDYLGTINKATEAIELGAQALKSYYSMGLSYAIESSENMISDVKAMDIDASDAEKLILKAKETLESQEFGDLGILIGDIKDMLSELEEQLAQKTSDFLVIIQSNIDKGKEIKADMTGAENKLNEARTQLNEESKLEALSTARQSESLAKEAVENRIKEISDLIARTREAIDEAKYLNAPVSDAGDLHSAAQEGFENKNYVKAEEDANSALQAAQRARDEQIEKAIRYRERITTGGTVASPAAAESGGALAQETGLGEKPSPEERAQKVCPTCGADAIYVEQYDRYYCYTCSAYIEPVDREAAPKTDKVCPKCSGEPKFIEQYQRYYCYSCNEYMEPVEKSELAATETETAPEEPAEEEKAAMACPKCGREPKYVEQYNRYYCYSCSEYVEPVEKAERVVREKAEEEKLEEETIEEKEEEAKVCPSCGGEPKYVEQYDRYYCYSCSEYVKPGEKEEKAEEEKPGEETIEEKEVEAKVCPKCGGEPKYVEQYDRYYCYSCSEYVVPMEKEEKKDEEEPEGRICPECSNTSTYVEQYDRYYCYTCSKYLKADT